MDVRDILKEYLTNNGYDGLYCDYECGCLIDDLIPCTEPFDHCQPGYKTPCDCGDPDHEWHIGPKKIET